MEMNPPKIASFLPALAEFMDVLTQDVKSGKLDNWEKFSASTQEFYTPAVMKQIETFIPGWGRMASFADGATLVHVTSVLVVLKLTPEYQRATPAEKILFEWIALLHDIAKEVHPGKRDHGHGFRSAIVAGRDLPKLGFPVTSDYEGFIEEWAKLTNSAIRLDADGEAYIQDNRRLPEILAGIDKLFGRNTATSVIIKAVLLHFSIDTVRDWPQTAPLSEAEIKLYLDESFVPYLEIIMLADSDAWALFDKEIKEKQRQETLLAFQKVRLLLTLHGEADESHTKLCFCNPFSDPLECSLLARICNPRCSRSHRIHPSRYYPLEYGHPRIWLLRCADWDSRFPETTQSSCFLLFHRSPCDDCDSLHHRRVWPTRSRHAVSLPRLIGAVAQGAGLVSSDRRKDPKLAMNISRQTVIRWLPWPAWVIANILAILAGYAIGLAVAPLAARVDIYATDRIISMVMVPAIGLAFGLFQWFVIRLRFPLSSTWILATFLGWSAPIVLLPVSPLVTLLNDRLGIGLMFTAIGLGTGLAQYLVLRPRVQRAGWWMVGSVAGWLVLGILLETPITNLWGTALIGAIPAIVTGFFLALILTGKPLLHNSAGGSA